MRSPSPAAPPPESRTPGSRGRLSGSTKPSSGFGPVSNPRPRGLRVDFEPTDEQKMIRQVARDFAEAKVKPIAAESAPGGGGAPPRPSKGLPSSGSSG